jgi:alpha-tubulin suppressor-like RCC1 family protein
MEFAVQHRSRAAARFARAVVLGAVTTAMLVLVAPASPAHAFRSHPTPDVAQAWGLNTDGELGDGTTATSDVPVEVSGLRGVTAIAAGARHTLALLEDGTVMSWGENFFGQLGDGTTANSGKPVEVSGLHEVAAIAAGERDSFALLRDGGVVAWGHNAHGQLGSATTEDSDVPVAVEGLSNVVAISAGGSFSLALLRGGAVMAWGEDFYGQLGDGARHDSDVPVRVSGLSGVTAISAGFRHSLALLSSGAVMAWGENEYGQLGDGTETESDLPIAVTGLSRVSAVSAGESQSLAIVAEGAVMAWGDNEKGELGDGTHTGPEQCGSPRVFACSKTPVRVSGLTGVTAISADAQNLALLADGAVMAWGPNSAGELGDGTSDGPEPCGPLASACSSLPVLASTQGVIAGIAAGGESSFAFGPPPPAGQLPELGRCVAVPDSGAYKGAGPHCTAMSKAHHGRFEWLPGPGPRRKFTDELSQPMLETVGGHRVGCTAGMLEGDYTGPKTEALSGLTLQGCRDLSTNMSCQTNPMQEGLIASSLPLQGDLGFITSGGRRAVGWKLESNPPTTPLLVFVCGSTAEVLEGSVIGRVAPIDSMTSEPELLYRQRKGRQLPEFFEPSVRDALMLTTTPLTGSESSEQVGLSSNAVQIDEQPLEIKAKP